MSYSERTSKDILIGLCGITAVYAYEDVKRVSMMLGHELANALILHVGGSVGGPKDQYDGRSTFGDWEFCLQSNSKNKAGRQADEERCPGRCVQILQRPEPGWMSGQRFLEIHGFPASDLDDIIEATVERIKDRLAHQQRLPV